MGAKVRNIVELLKCLIVELIGFTIFAPSNHGTMIKENLEKIRATLPESVTLVAVSKTKPVSDLQEAYDAGQHIFGENHAL